MKDHVFIFVDPFFFAPPPKADSFVVAFFSLFLSSSLHVVDFFFHSSLSLSLTKVDDGTFIIFCGAYTRECNYKASHSVKVRPKKE